MYLLATFNFWSSTTSAIFVAPQVFPFPSGISAVAPECDIAPYRALGDCFVVTRQLRVSSYTTHNLEFNLTGQENHY